MRSHRASKRWVKGSDLHPGTLCSEASSALCSVHRLTAAGSCPCSPVPEAALPITDGQKENPCAHCCSWQILFFCLKEAFVLFRKKKRQPVIKEIVVERLAVGEKQEVRLL